MGLFEWYFGFRPLVRFIIALVPLAYFWNLLPGRSPLQEFGRSSLFVYWIHVELVYGYFAWSLYHRLPLWGTFVAYAIFSVLMYGAVVLRDRIAEWWHEMSDFRTVEETS